MTKKGHRKFLRIAYPRRFSHPVRGKTEGGAWAHAQMLKERYLTIEQPIDIQT